MARRSALAAAATLAMTLAGALALAQSTGLDRDERVLVYPTAAALDASGTRWRVPVHVCVFEPESGDPLRNAALAPLRRLVSFEAGSEEAKRFDQRARLFLVDHERHEQVNVAIGDALFRVGPTAPSGHCEQVIELPVETAAKLAKERRIELSIGAAGDPTGARGVVELVPPEGLSIVSDVDDTIKVTDVGDRRQALANTLLREFRAVPGMAPLYAKLAAAGGAFHYVSLSPWQLAPLLDEFLAREKFPRGSLHLQPFRVQDGDFADLVGDSREKKLAAVEPLLLAWPKRRFVLVGDSGQLDPEVYGELARRHPEQVELVLIRDPRLGVADDEPAATRRYSAAFEGVERERWQRFADPAAVRVPGRF